jgi:hypothetical protein
LRLPTPLWGGKVRSFKKQPAPFFIEPQAVFLSNIGVSFQDKSLLPYLPDTPYLANFRLCLSVRTSVNSVATPIQSKSEFHLWLSPPTRLITL